MSPTGDLLVTCIFRWGDVASGVYNAGTLMCCTGLAGCRQGQRTLAPFGVTNSEAQRWAGLGLGLGLGLGQGANPSCANIKRTSIPPLTYTIIPSRPFGYDQV